MDIKEKINELLAAPSCCQELKDAANAYLAASCCGKKAAADALVAELEEDVMTVDHVIGFFGSEDGKNFFGAEKAAQLLAGAQAHKAAGGKYCNCPACAAGAEILANKELLYK